MLSDEAVVFRAERESRAIFTVSGAVLSAGLVFISMYSRPMLSLANEAMTCFRLAVIVLSAAETDVAVAVF